MREQEYGYGLYQVEMKQPIYKNYHFHAVSKLNFQKTKHWTHLTQVEVDTFHLQSHHYLIDDFAIIFY